MRIDYETGPPEKVIQIMPLPKIKKCSWDKSRPLIDFVDQEGREYYTIGAALTNQGNVYPLLYDGEVSFIARREE